MGCLVLGDSEGRVIRHHKQQQDHHQCDDRPSISKPPGKAGGTSIIFRTRDRGKQRIVENETDLHHKDRQAGQQQRGECKARVRLDKPQQRRSPCAEDCCQSEEGLRTATLVCQTSQNGCRNRNQQRSCRCHPRPCDRPAFRHDGGGEEN